MGNPLKICKNLKGIGGVTKNITDNVTMTVVLLFSLVVSDLVICVIPGHCLTTDATKPNIILLMLDTVRADHLGTYGYKKQTSQSLDGLAADSVIYENCISSAPWTAPSMGTILTSRHPNEHHCGERITGEAWKGNPKTMGKIRDDLPTMAGLLNKAGFQTHVVLANPVLTEFGIFDSFQSCDSQPGNDSLHNCRRAGSVTDAAIQWLDEKKSDAPFFLMVHYIDPHAPYDPPLPPDMETLDNYANSLAVSKERAKAIAYYDYEIRHMDEQIGRFLGFLKKKSLYDNTMIITVSDHGDDLWDHFVNEEKYLAPTIVCGNQHGETLFQELIHVPLFVKFPQKEGAGGRVSSLVGSIDILPTVLRYFDLAPLQESRGVILPQQDDAKRDGGRMVFSEYLANLQELKSVTFQSGQNYSKLIVGAKTKKKRWFDLLKDSAELLPETEVPITAEREKIDDALGKFVKMSEGEGGNRKIISDKAIKSLKTLGYMK